MDKDTINEIARDYHTDEVGLCDAVEACLDLIDSELDSISSAKVVWGPTYWALCLTHKMLIRLLKKLAYTQNEMLEE